jgi:hypothetical protein
LVRFYTIDRDRIGHLLSNDYTLFHTTEIEDAMKKYQIQKALPAAIFAFIFCFACTSSEDGSDAGGPIAGNGSGGAGSGGSAGTESDDSTGSIFTIKLDPLTETTNIQGQVCDARPLTDRLIVWDMTQEKEGCKLLEPRTPFCYPPCEVGGCVEDYVCAAEHNCFDVGTVNIKGLQNAEGKESLSLRLVVKKYNPPSENLLYPPFAEGDPVRLEASGAEAVEAFSIESSGIAPLEVLTPDGVFMDYDTPVTLEWVPATIADNSRIEIRVDISHHGGQRGEIVCDVADTGSFEIPADMVTALMDLGYAGLPSLTVERFALGSTTIAQGRVDLRVSSIVEQMIDIPGLISCSEPGSAEGCPEGQICQDDYRCVSS